MMTASRENPNEFESEPSGNAEREDLEFLRDEGLELLALFKSIGAADKRRVILDLIRIIASETPKR